MTTQNGHTFLAVLNMMVNAPLNTIADCINVEGQDSIIKQEEFICWYDPATDTVLNPVINGTSLLNSNLLFQFRPYYISINEMYNTLKTNPEGVKAFLDYGNDRTVEVNLNQTLESLGLNKATLAQLFTGRYYLEGGE
jgi:hypothetical protein